MWHVKHGAPTEPGLWLIDLSINIGSLRDSMQVSNRRWPHYPETAVSMIRAVARTISSENGRPAI
jgi:hypothetical protein